MIPQKEIKTIKVCYIRSVAPRHLANYYNVQLHEITDILGLPRDVKLAERMHREKNFYDHGKGEKMEELKIEYYGSFLHEGDFEKYQSYCYKSHLNPMFWITKWNAKRIKKTDNVRDEVRRLWILMRFEDYQEAGWSKLNDQLVKNYKKF